MQFFFVEASDLYFSSDNLLRHEDVHAVARNKLYDTLLEDFAVFRKSPKRLNLDDYGVVMVSPSVVPNPYLPSFRIFSYNITAAESRREGEGERPAEDGLKQHHGHHHRRDNRDTLCKKKKYQKTW